MLSITWTSPFRVLNVLNAAFYLQFQGLSQRGQGMLVAITLTQITSGLIVKLLITVSLGKSIDPLHPVENCQKKVVEGAITA